MKEILLCKYGEIILKGANRRYFEDMLERQLKRKARAHGNFNVYRAQSTLYVEPLDEAADMDGMLADAQVVPTNGSGHGALAGFLAGHGVDCVICGGIGPGAQMALAEAGIKLYAGCSGDADQCVTDLLTGTLVYVEAATCDHHRGEEAHACGDHGCGSHDHTCGH